MRILIDGQTLATPDLQRGIGRVFLGLCNEMISRDASKQWLLALPAGCDASALSSEAGRRVQLRQVPAPDLSAGYEPATKVHREAIQEVCDAEQVDLYWCPNPLMLNVVLPAGLEGPVRVCTLHDVIPARLPGLYQSDWSPEARREYAQRLDQLASWPDHLVFVSQASRDDFAALAPGAESARSVIHNGVDHGTFWASAAIESALDPPVLLMVAGADPRKNTARAIEAVAKLVARGEAPAGLVLRIAGRYDAASERKLLAQCKGLGVEGYVELCGEVDDARLSRLYRESVALLFPSLYEGFGLPVVEAMASGLPLVLSDRPELRELSGDAADYFDPNDADDIAAALARVLAEPALARRRARQALQRARGFCWRKAASAYVDRFDALLSARGVTRVSERPRVAWASPWPPDRSGIAAYSYEIVCRLREHADVEIFLERADRAERTLDLPIHDLRRLTRLRKRFDRVVYHLGNSTEHHRSLYRNAWEHPGISVLHELNIHPFLQSAYLGTPEEYLYREALAESHGSAGAEHFERVRSRRADPDIWRFPGSLAVARRSEATIVHSEWIRRQLDGAGSVHVIPMGAAVRRRLGAEEQRLARRAIGVGADEHVIGVFGFMNTHKRIPSVLEACRRLRASGHPVRLVLVGDVNDERLRLSEEIARHGAASFTSRTGFVDDETFFTHMDACDAVVNLRYPSMGESSASLLRALGSGKACIVSEMAQFEELPDSICWKVATDEGEVDELVACLSALLCDTDLREQLAHNAHEFVARYCSYESTARRYAQVLCRAGSLSPDR